MNTISKDDPIRLALPSKGSLHEGAVELLREAGYSIKRAGDRQYEAKISGRPRFQVLLMRPTDIVTQVEEGRCALGVTGYDLYAERAFETRSSLVVSRDLGYGGCRLVVAAPEDWVDVTHAFDLVELISQFKHEGKTFRVSTKYPALVRAWFRKWGAYHFSIVESAGALELHPSLGIADIIVDLTSSGATLKENRLKEVEAGTVLESTACLLGHGESLARLRDEGESGPLAIFLDALDGVRSSERKLHLEAVGACPEAGGDRLAPARLAAAFLVELGAEAVVQGEVFDASGGPAWRVTALLPADRFAECRRPLAKLGAARVAGIPVRASFAANSPSTFDNLCGLLSKRTAAAPAGESA